MNGFLEQLTTRNLEGASAPLRPRLLSRFEEGGSGAGNGSLEDNRSDDSALEAAALATLEPPQMPAAPPSFTTVDNAPRRPADGTLYQIVRDHFETFRAHAAPLRDGEGVPRFVEQEFRDFLQCGWLAGGFARFRCGGCGLDRAGRRARALSRAFERLRSPCRSGGARWAPRPTRARLSLYPPPAGAERSPSCHGRRAGAVATPASVGRRNDHLVFDPVELLGRLAVLVPRPRINLVLYHGVLGPRAAWRADVVRRETSAGDRDVAVAKAHGAPADHVDAQPAPRHARGYAWAELMRRTFGLDVLACPRCGGRLRLVALIEEAAVIDRILRHLGLPTAIPAPRPARAPPLPVDVPDGSGGSDPPSGFDACS